MSKSTTESIVEKLKSLKTDDDRNRAIEIMANIVGKTEEERDRIRSSLRAALNDENEVAECQCGAMLILNKKGQLSLKNKSLICGSCGNIVIETYEITDVGKA